MTRFEFQKWPVYETALGVVAQAYQVCNQLPRLTAPGLRDQLKRASQSIPLNIAEGSSRYTSRDKAQFFRIARGSVFECVAILDLIPRLGFKTENLTPLYNDLETIGRMLSGLTNYVESESYKMKRKGFKSAERI